MTEKILTTKKNGMAVLLASLAVMVLGTVGFFVGISMGEMGAWIGVPCIILTCLTIIPLAGLKILKPQEALVLTLFGKYIGTLKGEGFYFVNPFCSAINPAAKTKLNQSGDVKTKGVNPNEIEMPSKKLSLKIMTLNNAKQKIND